MSKTEFKPDTDDLDPEETEPMGTETEPMGTEPKPQKEKDGDISFQLTGSVFDPDPREMPKQRRRRPKMGK